MGPSADRPAPIIIPPNSVRTKRSWKSSPPLFGRNGTLLTTPGYHPDARLLYVPAPGFAVPDIPAKPTPAEIAAARTLIYEDLLGDFPFTTEAERAHVVALLLLGLPYSQLATNWSSCEPACKKDPVSG
ncbi:hypothetical protein [Roseovarius salis]|uniref:hypothetical protein n=1 Tax=Roseovarius salis TaxID=3376063 RepID=UPI0037CB5324